LGITFSLTDGVEYTLPGGFPSFDFESTSDPENTSESIIFTPRTYGLEHEQFVKIPK
jgi:hypothetical protein